MKHGMVWAVLVCTLLPVRAASSHCEEAMESLRQSLQNNDFEVYARMLERKDEFTCELDDDLLGLLAPRRMQEFDESLKRMGINLMDTSLHRLVWEQARWSLLSREQMERFSNSRELAAPASVMSQLAWMWWLGGGCLVVSLSLLLWGERLRRKSYARPEGRVEWTTDVVDFEKALEASRTPEEFDRALFWLRFLQLNDQMMGVKNKGWARLSRRERELCLMLLEHWDTPEICAALQVSSQHLYKLRSKLRASLNLDSNEQLMPALKAWANRE